MKSFTATRIFAVLLAIFLVALFTGYAVAQAPATVTPAPRGDESWVARHKAMNERVKKGNIDLIFIGDSITQGWEDPGKDTWEKFYAKRNAVNLGISGDQTQHVLWRLENGNIEGISPKLAVIMIGTNNASDNTAEEIAEGVKAIVNKLREKLPQTKILLLAVFPREEKPGARREKLTKVNGIISGLADGKMIHFVDIGPKFIKKDGTLPKSIMPDALHPNTKGYEIWADAIEPKVAELMGEKK
jgi:beta-glucosidase